MKRLKSIISILLCLALICTSFGMNVQFKAAEKYVKSLSVKKKVTVTIPRKKKTTTKNIKVTVKTKGKASKKIKAKIDDKTIAKVKVVGNKIRVKAKAEGNTYITVTTKGKGEDTDPLTQQIKLTVKKNYKAKLNTKKTVLYCSPYVNSKKISDGHQSVTYSIDYTKKKAKYTAKISNKKIAGVAKTKKGKQYIYAKKVGKTKAKIYEKRKGHKKRYVGKLTIKVEQEEMGSVVETMFSDTNYKGFQNIFIKTHLGKPTHDLGAQLKNFLVGNKTFDSKFKETDFSVVYSIYDGEQYINLSDKGLISGIKNGTAGITANMTFKDGSTDELNSGVHVFGYALTKIPGYSIDTLQDKVIGLDQQVQLEDGTWRTQTHFNNAATTLEFKHVSDTIQEKKKMYGAVERSESQKSKYTTAIYNNTRDKVIEFLGADPEKYSVFYTNTTTDGLNKLASALITSKKDMVLATRIEHHANDLSWRERCKVKYAEVDKKGRVRYDELKRLLKKYNKKKKRIKLVTITAASNVTGYVTNVHKVAKLAHKYGAKIVVDGAQIVAHRKFSMVGDLKDPKDDIDFFAFSAHKMYSPEGGGAVVGLTKVLNKHKPMFYGGGTIKVVGDNWVYWKKAPEVYEAGSPDYLAVVGMGAAMDCLYTIGFDKIQAHEQVLIKKLIAGLKKLPKVIIYGDTENVSDKTGVVTFNFYDINTEILAQRLAQYAGIDTRRGAFCAHPYVWRLMGISDETAKGFENCSDAKTAGMVRISFATYSTEADIDYFFEKMPTVMDQARKITYEEDTVPEY